MKKHGTKFPFPLESKDSRYWLGSGVVVPENPRAQPLRCEHCDGELQLLAIVAADGRVLVTHGVSFLDSG